MIVDESLSDQHDNELSAFSVEPIMHLGENQCTAMNFCDAFSGRLLRYFFFVHLFCQRRAENTPNQTVVSAGSLHPGA